MNQQTYLKDRVEDQMNWYDRKSQWNQKRYKRLRFVATLLAVSIPFATGFLSEDTQWLKYSIGLAGVLITLIEFVLSMNKYEENWVQYRAAAEALKREKILFETSAGRYLNTEAPFQEFVIEIEKILADEHGSWLDYISDQPKID